MNFRIISVLVYLNIEFGATDGPVVKTSSGTVKGLTIEVLNKSIDQFLGIPYAESPLGSLRFAKPKPISKPIEGIIDATKPKYSCIQPYFEIYGRFQTSEDCLLLNIWSPKKSVEFTKKLKPVMFWIFGGGLVSGSIFQKIYNGSVLATHDIVFVSVNYRLGNLGFFFGGQDSAPGNVGLYDQLLGLKWVRENIHLFGGDKNQITFFGESAGSQSVSSHIISPLSRGLFKRAIMESGAHLHNKNRLSLTKSEALKNTKQLAKRVNCTDDKQWLECLRKVDPNLLNEGLETSQPVEGTEFLPFNAQKAFKDKNFSTDIDLLAGVVQNEGTSFVILPSPFNLALNNTTDQAFNETVENLNGVNNDISLVNVRKYYLKDVDTNDSTALKKGLIQFLGDLLIKCPTYHFAKLFAKNTRLRKTYFYELTYQGKYATDVLACDEKSLGICHAADLEFVFGLSLIDSQLYSQTNVEFSRKVMKMWTNFAKTGVPDENWINKFVHHGHSVIKNLNPSHLGEYFVDPFKSSCDQFWKNYFE